MDIQIKSIKASGLYGRFNIDFTFNSGITIFYGRNGGGKTTLLHILANALNGDFDRFAFLKFKFISIEFINGSILKITRYKENEFSEGLKENDYSDSIIVEFENEIMFSFSINEIVRDESSIAYLVENNPKIYQTRINSNNILNTAYYPAFRNVIDAFKSNNLPLENETQHIEQISSTEYIRRWLSPFVPTINYPSLTDVENSLSTYKQQIPLSNDISMLLEHINNFLYEKKVEVSQSNSNVKKPLVEVVFEDGWRSRNLESLSSGERQIATILYATTQLSGYKVLLIDEPEISLHVDWQRLLIHYLSKISSNVQIIICTHSPIIGAEYDMVKLPFVISSNSINDEIPF